MKRILLVVAALAALTACKEEQQGDTRTPKGIIIEAVTALSQNRSADFNNLLAGVAAQKYSSVEIQKDLLKSLGDIRKITLGSEKVISHNVSGNSTVTISSVDVIKSGNPIYTVVTQCVETTVTSSHTVCPAPPSTYYPPSHHDNGGYHNGGYDNGGYHNGGYDNGGSSSHGSYDDNNNSSGGYITPGITHEVDPSSGPSDDGHKPGNNDPDRPPRFLVNYSASTNFNYSSDCYEVPDSSTTVSCKIIDLQ